MRVLVTGGAGFIGSHVVDRLMDQGHEVVCYDNLSSGKREFIAQHLQKPEFRFLEADLLDMARLNKAMEDVDTVYHIAANPDVKVGAVDTSVHLQQNIIATYNVLEAMRRCGVKNILFTSTSTVYGDAKVIPTPEDYGPLVPISLYGASKLGCEALITAYAHTFDMRCAIFRFANIVGERSTHGVIYDFINKLRKNPEKLEILGDGTQCKSYCHIKDCVDAMFFAWEKQNQDVGIYNIGSEDYITVKEIADIVVEEMQLKNVEYQFTGGVDGGRGWKGDVKVMRLSIEKLKRMGWKPTYNSGEAVRHTTRVMLRDKKMKCD